MLTTMRQIGNSRGVLIPAAFLASCQIETQVDMQLQDGQIVIRPVKSVLREGWFTPATSREVKAAAKAAELERADAQAWADAPLADDSEWTW